jgi:TonB-linked SusC/RagA family outer membrane protein
MNKYAKRNFKIPKYLVYRVGILFLFVVLLGNSTLFAQNTVIKGKVTDSTNGEPIPGVNIVVSGTTIGTVTDLDGNYKLSVPSTDGALTVSYVGYLTQKVAISGRIDLSIALVPDVKALDEVVVIGYGTAARKDLTGAISSVNAKKLKDIPVSSTAEALTGKLAGVQITTTEGSPDADIKIRVRGGGSISQDNSPLYVVDGFPVDKISDIAPSDIQSIDVLKDGSTSAIYGARGANGVIIITTKGGKEGKVSVDFNTYFGVKKNEKELAVLSPYEYVYLQYEQDPAALSYGAFDDLEIYKSIQGTNYQKEVFGNTAIQKNYNLSINGGTKLIKYNLSLNHANEESILINSGYERSNANLKLNSEISKSISIDFSTRFAYTTIDGAGVNTGAGSNSSLRDAVKFAPVKTLAAINADEDYIDETEKASTLTNPIAKIKAQYKQQRRLSSNTNLAVNIKFLKDFTYRAEGGFQLNRDATDYAYGPDAPQTANYGKQPIARKDNDEGGSWRIANTVTFDKKNIFSGHNINILLGQETNSSYGKSIISESRFFPAGMTNAEALAMMNLGTAEPTRTTIDPDLNLSSFFGRVSYSAYDRYLLSATFRADGSSLFEPGNQWGYFPSVALAWKVNQENFMDFSKGWLSQLKLRVSYGTAGNNRIPAGSTSLLYTTTNSSGDASYYINEKLVSQLKADPKILPNPDLKWETTVTRNIGLDFGFFNSRLAGSVDYYNNKTVDLLVQAPLPPNSGYQGQYQNVGQTSNKGVEIVLDGLIINKKDFTLSASFNIGFNKNNVDKFKNGEKNWKTYNSGWLSGSMSDDYIIQEGKPVGQIYGYTTEGMYSFDDFTFVPAATGKGGKWAINKGVADNSSLLAETERNFGPGSLKFKDISGPNGIPDSIIDNYDKSIIGNTNPLHTGGFSITATYKGFDFSAFFNWTYGNDVLNANKCDYTDVFQTRKYNNMLDIMSLNNRFTYIDPVNGNNVFQGENADPARLQAINENKNIWSPLFTGFETHSWAVEDGSFLRLNNVTLGYTLPEILTNKIGIQKLRIYVTGYNLWIWTNYSGFDPEVDTRRSTPMTPSVDYSAFPKSRSFIAGINLTF